MKMFKPEGVHWEVRNDYTIDEIQSAQKNKDTLEAKVLKCDEKLNLIVDLGDNITGIIKYNDIEFSPFGKMTRSVSIMAKVGKCVKFKVGCITKKGNSYTVECSRAAAQKECYDEYISKLTPGDIIPARILHIEKYGMFCDIGCGLVALLPIENVSILRNTEPQKIFRTWKDLFVVVKDIDDEGKITLTHKELLGTWDEEVSKFKVGETVSGTVKTIEDYGVFIELSQNLAGLAEVAKNVRVGDKVNVNIKDIMADKMKIKLIIISSETPDPEYIEKPKFKYTMKHGHIDEWKYSPENCKRYIGTKFN